MFLRKVGLVEQAVGLVDEVLEGAPWMLVIAVHADEVHDVVAGITLGPGDRLGPANRSEVEAECLARHTSHHRNDAPPEHLPCRGVRSAPSAVRGAVHFPSQDDDRLSGLPFDEPVGENLEMVVELTFRAAA
jgi:hypothetical protein